MHHPILHNPNLPAAQPPRPERAKLISRWHRLRQCPHTTKLAPSGQKYNIVRENISLSHVVITHKRAKKKFGKTLQESFQSFTFVRYYKYYDTNDNRCRIFG